MLKYLSQMVKRPSVVSTIFASSAVAISFFVPCDAFQALPYAIISELLLQSGNYVTAITARAIPNPFDDALRPWAALQLGMRQWELNLWKSLTVTCSNSSAMAEITRIEIQAVRRRCDSATGP